MKRTCILLVTLAALLVVTSVFAVVKTSAFHVDGMKNDVAAQRVTQAVKAVPGVQDAVADKSTGILMVRYDNAKASVIDLSEAVNNAGYTLGAVEAPGQGTATTENTNQKAKAVLTDFAQVIEQTKEFLDKERYGIIRNLAPAMKVRADAVVSFEKSVAPAKVVPGTANTYQLAQNLQRAVADFAASADAKDKAAVKAKFPGVKQSFKALADARNFDDLVAPSVTAQGQPSQKTIEEQLKEYITKVFGGK